MSDLFGLEGKRVMVIGGGQGMGEATVKRLASLGCSVAVVDLELERAERVAATVVEAGVEAIPIGVDVLDDQALIDAVARIESEFGPLDGLATIVGMAGWSPIEDMSTETWDHDHRRNLRYFFLAAQQIGKRLIARKSPGSIVCVASIDGLRSAAYHASYGAAKAGLINLVKSMSAEWSQYGIRVNCVAPGSIITPRIPDRGPEVERVSMATVPMRRRGTAEEIAKAITFFLSDQATYVTGQTLAVDGGYLAVGPLPYKPFTSTGGTLGLDIKPG